MLAAAAAAGVKVTVSQKASGGETALLPGIRKKQFTEAEQQAFEDEMNGAGIRIVNPDDPEPGEATIYLLNAAESPAEDEGKA